MDPKKMFKKVEIPYQASIKIKNLLDDHCPQLILKYIEPWTLALAQLSLTFMKTRAYTSTEAAKKTTLDKLSTVITC